MRKYRYQNKVGFSLPQQTLDDILIKAESKSIIQDGKRIIKIGAFRKIIAYTRDLKHGINCLNSSKQVHVLSMLKKDGKISLNAKYAFINDKI